MSKHTVKAIMPFAYDGMEVIVTFTYSPGSPEVRYLRNGDPGYPAEPAEVEFVSAEPEAGVTLPLALKCDLNNWCESWLADEGYALACASAGQDREDDRAYSAEMAADAWRDDR